MAASDGWTRPCWPPPGFRRRSSAPPGRGPTRWSSGPTLLPWRPSPVSSPASPTTSAGCRRCWGSPHPRPLSDGAHNGRGEDSVQQQAEGRSERAGRPKGEPDLTLDCTDRYGAEVARVARVAAVVPHHEHVPFRDNLLVPGPEEAARSGRGHAVDVGLIEPLAVAIECAVVD